MIGREIELAGHAQRLRLGLDALELDALVGALVRLGEQVNVLTPLHQFFASCLLPMEMKARGEIAFPV